jgi:hypothetical protein
LPFIAPWASTPLAPATPDISPMIQILDLHPADESAIQQVALLLLDAFR